GNAKNSDAYLRFSLAVDQGKDDAPLWVTILCWKYLAERLKPMVHKGSLVFAQGRLHVRTYTDKNNVERQAVEVVADDVQVLGKQQKAHKQEPAAKNDENAA